MTLLSLIVALLIEQLRPLSPAAVLAMLRQVLAVLEARLGERGQWAALLIWVLIVLPPTLAAALLFFILWHWHPLLALAFNIACLYLTMGFRQESHFFSDIHLALRLGELDRARSLLAQWRGGHYLRASSGELTRLAIEGALVASHRNVFGVVFWFVLLPGPSGALFYRLARFMAEQSATDSASALTHFSKQAFGWIDALPVRLTAAAFSIVGDFEGAVYCWRTQAMQWPDKAAGILIAAGAGALGVRLGLPIHEAEEIVERPEMGTGEEADLDFMQGAVGLIWRALVLCLLTLGLLGIAGWAGG